MVPRVRDCLAASRKYFTQFCVKFVSSFIPKFISSLYKCKPVSTVGAEQLLLDTHSLKTVLIDLPNICESAALKPSRKAPVAYTKVVVKGMTRAEMILKVVMSHSEPANVFVDQYIRLVQDPDSAELVKLLDMKAIRRNDQTNFIQIFKQSEHQIKGDEEIDDINLSASTDFENLSEETKIRKLEKLIKKRL